MSFFLVIIALFLLINLKGLDPVDYIIPLALMVSLVLSLIKGKTRKLNTKMTLFFLIFFIGYSLSILLNTYSFSYLMNLLLNIGLFLLIINNIDSEKVVRAMFLWLTIGAGVTSLMALSSILLDISILPDQFNVIRHNRYLGMYGDPNILGSFLVFLFFYWLGQLSISGKYSRYGFLLPAFFIIMLLTQIVATSSRSSIGGMILGSVIYFIIFILRRDIMSSFQKITMYLIPIILLVGVSIVPVYDTVIDRLGTVISIEYNEEERFAFIYTAAAIDVAITNPFGVGPGQTNFATGIQNADGGTIGAHNAFVQIFSDNGWLTGFSVIFAVIAMWLTSFKDARRGIKLLGIDQSIMLASLTSFIFIGMFQDLMQWKVIWVFFGILIAMQNASPRYKKTISNKTYFQKFQHNAKSHI